MISGKSTLIAHRGCPTFPLKAPLIYNPWSETNGIDAVVVPMGVRLAGRGMTARLSRRRADERRPAAWGSMRS